MSVDPMDATSEPRHATVLGLGPNGFHRVAFAEWGGRGSPALLCVHGLTRNGRDFDEVASALRSRYRVVCPDLPGRGRSEWLSNPLDYSYPVYLSDLNALLARLDVEAVDWLGTSLGGILGMMAAAQPGSPVRRLILNDVGPFIPRAALARIATYVGEAPLFRDVAEAESFLRTIHAPFGPLTDDQWARLAARSVERLSDGRFRLAYDPALAVAVGIFPVPDFQMWAIWDQIRCPVLLLRGGESDLLPAEVAREMQHRGPAVELVEFPGVGHAPALMAEEQISVIREWLEKSSSRRSAVSQGLEPKGRA